MLQDLRYAVRMLAVRPSFTIVAVMTLAIGIGANVAIFSIVEGVLLKPLPLENPDRLVVVWDTHPSLPVPFMVASPPRVIEWRKARHVFAEVGAFVATPMTITDGSVAEQIPGAAVYQGLLQALGVPPAAGRFFTDEDYRRQAPRAVLLTDALWRRRFGADPGLIGRTIRLSGYDHTVVGVMPASFNFVPSVTLEGKPPLERAQFFVPQRVDDPERQRGAHFLTVIARLRDGITIDGANRELKAVAARVAREHPDDAGWSVQIVPLLDQATAGLKPTLLTLLGAVAFVLLLACTNVASLLLARGIGRRRELAIRSALGAGRGRLARQLFTESLVLSGAGGAAGLLLASWCVRFARAYGPLSVTRLDEVQVDARVVVFAALASFAAAILFGLAPLAQMLRPNAAEWLKDRSGGAGGSSRARGALVVLEVAFAIVLLVGGVLLMESFVRLQGANPGFRPQHALTFRVALPAEPYSNGSALVGFNEAAVRRLAQSPGIVAAGAVDALPLAEGRQGTDITIEGRPEPPPGREAHAGFCFPTDGYFEAVGLPVLRGRTFTERDRRDSAPVIVVNQTFVRRFFEGQDPIGRRVHAGFNHQTAREIVGVVADELYAGLGREPQPLVYTPYAQVNWSGGLSFVVRSSADANAAAAIARDAIRAVDGGAAIYSVRTLDAIVAKSISTERFSAWLFAAFALAALVLALVGVYGVADQAVSQRTREFGVRIALGADSARIRSLVIAGTLRLSAAGVVIGVVLAAALSRAVEHQLFGTSPLEPRAYLAVAVLLTLAGAAAAYMPARRATKTDPMIALRAE